jgi:cytochrome c biogenesis protein CcdA
VKLSRLRTGELIALVSAIALAVLLALDWFFLSTPDARVGAHESGIRSLGWFAALLIVTAILLALALAFTTATQRAATAFPVVLSVLTTTLGALAFLAILLRLIAQPGLGIDVGNADVDIEPPAFLGLVAAAGIAYGGWRTMADERTDMPEAVEQTDEVLRVRGAPQPPPPAHAAAAPPDRSA